MPKSTEKPFDWERKGAEMALHLTFEGRWTWDEIAEKCSISTRTYAYWLKHPDFQRRLDTLRADFAASIRDEIYADKARRVIGLSQMAESARREYEERPWLKEVRPGPDGDITNESFNAAAHAAFRGALDDIAKELGERQRKVDVTSGGEKLSGVATAIAALLAAPHGEKQATDVLDALAEHADSRVGS